MEDKDQKLGVWNAFWAGAIAVKKLRLGTAVDPIIAVTAIISPVSLIVFLFVHERLLLLIAISPIIYFIRAYEHHMKYNPSMLRSEKHEEALLRLQAEMGHKGHVIPENVVDNLEETTLDKANKIEEGGKS